MGTMAKASRVSSRCSPCARHRPKRKSEGNPESFSSRTSESTERVRPKLSIPSCCQRARLPASCADISCFWVGVGIPAYGFTLNFARLAMSPENSRSLFLLCCTISTEVRVHMTSISRKMMSVVPPCVCTAASSISKVIVPAYVKDCTARKQEMQRQCDATMMSST